jgi:hypothetical protein
MAAFIITWAQAQGTVSVGRDATGQFQYQGRPVHPLCVSFAYGSARQEPLALAQCTDPKLTPTSKADGWLELDTGERASWVNYRVLARKGERFLITTDVSHGGTTSTTTLMWVRLGNGRVRVDKDVLGGQACSGGLSEFRDDGTRAIRFSASMTTSDMVALAAPARTKVATAGLSAAILSDCAGYATYRYDLERETLAIASVTLSTPPAREPSTSKSGPSSESDPQACFEQFVSEHLRRHSKTLTPSQLNAFGSSFLQQCDPRGRKQ